MVTQASRLDVHNVEPRPTLAERIPQLRLIEQLLVNAEVYSWSRDRAEAIAEGRCAVNPFSGYVSTAAHELLLLVDAGALDDGDVRAFIDHLHMMVH